MKEKTRTSRQNNIITNIHLFRMGNQVLTSNLKQNLFLIETKTFMVYHPASIRRHQLIVQNDNSLCNKKGCLLQQQQQQQQQQRLEQQQLDHQHKLAHAKVSHLISFSSKLKNECLACKSFLCFFYHESTSAEKPVYNSIGETLKNNIWRSKHF